MFFRPSCPPIDLPPLGDSNPKASIILVTYNTRGRFLEDCLDSIRRLEYPDYEVLIVDNASTDNTCDTLRAIARDETLILNPENRGFGGGCNDGAAKARGDILVFLNFDTVVERDWLREIVRPMLQDRQVGITGCKMLFPGSERIQHAGGILHGNGMSEHIGYREVDYGQRDILREVDYVTGAGLAIRREVFDLLGGFDPVFFPAYCEELDLCHRCRRAGCRVVFTPRAKLTHFESAVLENQSPSFQRLYYRNRMLFCMKNYNLADWLTRFLPYEIHWLRAPWSKGLRKKQIRAYLDMMRYLAGHRLTPDHPLPE